MLSKRKKLSKKEIKEDKLVTTYYKSIEFFENNKQKIALYAGILAVVVVGIIFYVNYRNDQNEKANLELSRVIPLYDAGSYLEAIEGRKGTKVLGLKKIVEEYGNYEYGEVAKIYLANAYNMLGKFDEALKYYEDYSGSNDIYKATSKAGQAGYYANKKEWEKAANLFMDAANISKENVLNAEYLLNAGIYYKEAGNLDEAKEIFKKVKKDYSNSMAAREVDRYLTVLED
ncbi:MAG: tetratricopeptide repeat protein [Syntrophothermus sp.]